MLALVQITSAQIKVTDFTEPELKGHVKRVTEYTWQGDKNNSNIDTTQNPEKAMKTFDENGRELSDVEYLQSGDLFQKFSFEYSGDTIATKLQFYDGQTVASYVYTYDKTGREIEFDTFLSVGGKPYSVYYKYDGKGNRVEENTNGTSAFVPKKTVITYNEKNEKIEAYAFLYNGKLNSRTIYEYDNYGRQTKAEIRDSSGKITTLILTSCSNTDINGNWLWLKSEYKAHNARQGNVSFIHITKRVIEYF